MMRRRRGKVSEDDTREDKDSAPDSVRLHPALSAIVRVVSLCEGCGKRES
jgi:hypothetical protein